MGDGKTKWTFDEDAADRRRNAREYTGSSAPGGPTNQQADLEGTRMMPPPESTFIYHGGTAGELGTDAGIDDFNGPVVAFLVIIKGPGLGRAVSLGIGVNSIGRDPGERVALPFGDMLISATDHARIYYDDQARAFYISHGSGKNVTCVNAAIVANRVPLKGHEMIQLTKVTHVRFVPVCGPDFDWSDLDRREGQRRGDMIYAGQSLGKRDNQEDGFRLVRQNDDDPSSDVLMLLADGMGGNEGGEVASAVALNAFLQNFLSGSESSRPRERLCASLQRSNEAIAERVAQSPELAGMGCTLLGSLKLSDRLVWISVGDSALYLFRPGHLRRLNADHSVHGEMRELVVQGKLSQEDADRHPRRNALRSLVFGEELALIDLGHAPLERGDVVLLASDGLETLGEDEIERTIRDGNSDPEQIGAALLAAVERHDRANQDNTTVLILRHDNAARTPPR